MTTFSKRVHDDYEASPPSGTHNKSSKSSLRSEAAAPREAIRVLVIDDDEDDYLIARDLLSEIPGTSFTVEWLPDPNAALEALAEDRHDICLLDYRLGRQNGLEILREAMVRGVTIPIILMTGQEDGDVDREAVQIGASDYLVKGRINSVLLDRAIRYARQQKQTLEALREQTEFVSAILDTAGALVLVLDRNGRIVRFNRQCEKTTGYDASEVLGRIYWEFLLPPESRDHAKEVFAALSPSYKLNSHESFWLTRNGECRCISFSNTSLMEPDGSAVAYVVSTGIDVTERKAAEDALALAREREVEVGASIQRTLLVRTPPIELAGLEIGARSIPSLKIGGDYFDFFTFGTSVVDVLVGDVMGKGVPAALLAAAAKNHFQRCVRRLGYSLRPYDRLPDPEEIVAAVHANLTRELVDLNSFITLAYARFDIGKRCLTFVDCGHPRPFHVVAKTGECRRISGLNVPLGMVESEIYRQVSVPFQPGDIFFFYSDGLTEAPSADDPDELFGEDRLAKVIEDAAKSGMGPDDVADTAFRTVQAFSGEAGAAQFDDLTCVAVRVCHCVAPHRMAFATCEISSNADELEEARDFVRNFCLSESAGFVDEDQADLLALGVNEGVGNVIEHAYRGRPNGRIQIEAEALGEAGDSSGAVAALSFRLYDSGEPFLEWDSVPEPAFDGSRDEGFGLFIMNQCFDRVEHRRDELGRNYTTLVKELSASPRI